ncbi:prenyltransferase [Lentzea sp. NPDC051213]|uniref:prenyltransferase n=1 Tax=Lentzea sp. NPDC051213 TaxID=3364126 RepID=UPI0037B96419
MREVPAVRGVLSRADVLRTGRSIARVQKPNGAIPWLPGGMLDPWDHVEAAMALSAVGLLDEAEAAYEWTRRTQRADGSWPMKIMAGESDDAAADSNFCAYVAVGVWHHHLISGSPEFVADMWPVVRRAVDFVLGLQAPRGEIGWARAADGSAVSEALVTGCASIHHSLRCALALADHVGEPQPDWEFALGRLAHVIEAHPEAFLPKPRFSMDWYYPVLGGVLRGEAGRAAIARRWPEFVVDGLGARCVNDNPWVTGAETCELVLALDALGEDRLAHTMFSSMQHLRERDGSYWTGLVYTDGKRWPVERTTWTGAAVVLAADALSRCTPGSGIFRAEDLPRGLTVECDCRISGLVPRGEH